MLLETFDHDGVRLLPSQLPGAGRRRARGLGACSNDDILKGFRRKADCRRRATDMRGWCKQTSAVIFGQLLSGMARLGRATGDDALIDKATALVRGLARDASRPTATPACGPTIGTSSSAGWSTCSATAA